jgi:hypothetical protein
MPVIFTYLHLITQTNVYKQDFHTKISLASKRGNQPIYFSILSFLALFLSFRLPNLLFEIYLRQKTEVGIKYPKEGHHAKMLW